MFHAFCFLLHKFLKTVPEGAVGIVADRAGRSIRKTRHGVIRGRDDAPKVVHTSHTQVQTEFPCQKSTHRKPKLRGASSSVVD